MTENEWRWFRASLIDALVRPRRFARSVAQEHYGLAGVLVALVAGLALSLTVDVAVILSHGADPLALLQRLLVDAFFLGARLLVVTALVALFTAGLSRAAGQRITLDQAFTALSFALSPLLFAPLVVPLLVVAGELDALARDAFLLGAIAVAVILVTRLVLGVALNLAALVGGAATIVAAAALVVGGLVLQDQVGRALFTTLTYAPQILPAPDAAPAEGQDVQVEGLRLRVPVDWKEVSRGVPGVAAQYELPDARIVVRLKSVSPLVTADAFAATEVQAALRDFTRIDRTARGLVRIDGVAAIDDRWYGRIDDLRLVERLYTLVVGRRGYLFEFQFFSPRDEEAALAQAARIAASIRVLR